MRLLSYKFPENSPKMHKNLVIVESPAKAKTIEKFLGKEFKVLSSFGHIRDLSKKGFGIDMSNNFKPSYEISPDKKKLVSELKATAAKAETIWLASDEDREGEAIAWHLSEVLGLDKSATKRIVFHEITKEAILNAIENPRSIDLNLVDAQQARRILDRIVGFELSPVLWKRIKPSLSAGRVQSVAVRLIVEREREIQNFVSEPFFKVNAYFRIPNNQGGASIIKAELQTRFKEKDQAYAFLEKIKQAAFSVEEVVTKPSKKSPAPPFTTSTLQQEASRKLGYSVSQTMTIAQRLYESGKITYMRTDSVNLSKLAIGTTVSEIESMAGKEYVKVRQYQTKSKGAQEAHEAIRPTYMSNRQVEGSAQERKLYELIWKRTIASQMADAELEKTTITIGVSNADEKFELTGEVLKFDGFLKVYLESIDDEGEKEEQSNMLPLLVVDDVLELDRAVASERFTQKPYRYTEASLVRKLEELGIGRPSTYAPTISTIQQRDYVVKEDREGQIRNYTVLELKNGTITDEMASETVGAERSKLFPTDIGMVVNDFLIEKFPDIMEYNFTASVEKEFDRIAEGKREWEQVIGHFYESFHPIVEIAGAYSKQKVGERILGEDPKTGKPISVRIGRFGPVVQIGTAKDEEKPLFASLRPNQRMDTLTLEDAFDLFKLPRKVGLFEEKEITVAVGRFGPYIRHDNKFVSIPKGIDPLNINFEECVDLIEQKRISDSKKLILSFEGEEPLQVLNGRFGPYILKDGNNYRIPKTTDPTTLTHADCLSMIESQGVKKPAKKGSKAAPKTSKSTATTKKAAPKGSKTTSTAKKAAATTKKATTTKKAPAKAAATTKKK